MIIPIKMKNKELQLKVNFGTNDPTGCIEVSDLTINRLFAPAVWGNLVQFVNIVLNY